jgi:superfamily II DNA or RNA helicase/SOS-response transcriptional repressor LexA
VIQADALRALAEARGRGERRGLVVLATGLGKTLLSAFDFAATRFWRALFVAHREEILEQACAQWGRVLPDRSRGLWVAGRREKGAELVFASIQALTRPGTLESIDPRDFDYVVIDEFHHAAASTYQKLLRHVQPRYLLGLTATPERGDGAELLALCDDNLVYRAGLRAGLDARLLVPFHYYAVMDAVDYAPIPWRSGRFDEAELTRALATREHAEAALAALDARTSRDSRRALVFCCSVAHADFMAEFLRGQGIAAAAVHSRATSATRTDALRKFKAGELVALTAVDLFNEGLDVPDIDAVLMLRPTESPVVFLQQIGRGLRVNRERAKQHLTVVDMVGNHRSYLDRLDALRFLLAGDRSRTAVLQALRSGTLEQPSGCEIHLPTEFVDVLEQLCVREREAESRAAVLALNPPMRLKVTHNARNPILVLDRSHRPDTPAGETEVEADGELYSFRFVKHFINVATRTGSEDNVLPDLLRSWFGAEAGWGKDFVALSFRRGRWRLEPVRASAAPIRHGVRYFPDLAVACGVGPLAHGEPDERRVAVRTDVAVDPKRHFVVRAGGDSMAGGEAPIHDGDLVLCEWARDLPLADVAGRPCVLVIHDGPEHVEVVLKTPIRDGHQWLLRSQAPGFRDRTIPEGAEVRVMARALGSVLLHG